MCVVNFGRFQCSGSAEPPHWNLPKFESPPYTSYMHTSLVLELQRLLENEIAAEDTPLPYLAKWHPGGSYHVYNRAVPLNRVFIDEEDLARFREKLRRLEPYASIYALGTAANHFHLHIRLFSLQQIVQNLLGLDKRSKLEENFLAGSVGFQKLVGAAFGRCFLAYAKSFNLRYDREGDLFNSTVRRRRVRNDLISRRLICYIHCQEIKHGLGNFVGGLGLKTTFQEFVDGNDNFVDIAAVFERFGSRKEFIERHKHYAHNRRAALARFNEHRFFGFTKQIGKPVWSLY